MADLPGVSERLGLPAMENGKRQLRLPLQEVSFVLWVIISLHGNSFQWEDTLPTSCIYTEMVCVCMCVCVCVCVGGWVGGWGTESRTAKKARPSNETWPGKKSKLNMESDDDFHYRVLHESEIDVRWWRSIPLSFPGEWPMLMWPGSLCMSM